MGCLCDDIAKIGQDIAKIGQGTTYLGNASFDMKLPIARLASLVNEGLYPQNIGDLVDDIMQLSSPLINAINETLGEFSTTSSNLSRKKSQMIELDAAYHLMATLEVFP